MSFISDQPLTANQLPISIEIPKENSEKFYEIIELLFKRIANSVNTKEGSLYDLQEVANFQQFFTDSDTQNFRPGYRRTFRFNDASLTFAHNITGIVECTRIYGTAVTAAGNFIPIPYVSTTLVNQIQIDVSPTQVIITKGAGAPAITQGIIVLEYLKT